MRAPLNPLIPLFASFIAAAVLHSPASVAAGPQSPDLCAESMLDGAGDIYTDSVGQTISRHCKPRVDPPLLDRDVCCVLGETASCKLPNESGQCPTGAKFWCEYGEVAQGRVTCLQAGPDACAMGHCTATSITPNAEIFEDSSWICCNDAGDECVYVGEGGANPPPDAVACYSGNITICSWGATNEDGTVDCLGT